MFLDLNTLGQGITELEYEIPVGKLAADTEMSQVIEPVLVKAKIFRSGQQISVDFKFQTVVRVSCSRCLEMTDIKLDSSFITDFRFQEAPLSADKIELAPDELDITWYRGSELDLNQQVRENILIDLPMQPLCKEACRGLCTQCGTNLNLQSCQCKEEIMTNPFHRILE